jgi:hypothetical protein
MRLRTYESFFLIKNGLLSTYPSLQKDISTEIVVLGGGITGALVSHALFNAGYDTVLLDKRDIGLGSTSATTAMLQYEIDTPLYKLAQQIGEEEAETCYRASQESIRILEKLIKKEKLECGFARKSSLYIAHNKKAAGWLQKEFEIRDKHQLGVNGFLQTNSITLWIEECRWYPFRPGCIDGCLSIYPCHHQPECQKRITGLRPGGNKKDQPLG